MKLALERSEDVRLPDDRSLKECPVDMYVVEKGVRADDHKSEAVGAALGIGASGSAHQAAHLVVVGGRLQMPVTM